MTTPLEVNEARDSRTGERKGYSLQGLVRRIWCGDALKLLSEIPDASVQVVITDMPYGMTQNKWDCLPDLAA